MEINERFHSMLTIFWEKVEMRGRYTIDDNIWNLIKLPRKDMAEGIKVRVSAIRELIERYDVDSTRVFLSPGILNAIDNKLRDELYMCTCFFNTITVSNLLDIHKLDDDEEYMRLMDIPINIKTNSGGVVRDELRSAYSNIYENLYTIKEFYSNKILTLKSDDQNKIKTELARQAALVLVYTAWARYFYSRIQILESYRNEDTRGVDKMLELMSREDYEFSSVYSVSSEEMSSEGLVEAFNTIKRVVSLGNKIKNSINVLKRKIGPKKEGYYTKYLGRLEGAYEAYADGLQIEENKPKGDLVKILLDEGPKYIRRVCNDVLKLTDDYTKLVVDIEKTGTYDEAVKLLEKFVTKDTIEPNMKVSQIVKGVKKDVRFKIANILLKDHKVYGHTVDSITEKKFPPVNHLLVTLFIQNPFEQPGKVNITELITTPDDFKRMANEYTTNVVDLSNDVTNKFGEGKKIETMKKGFKVGKENKETGENSKKNLTRAMKNAIVNQFIPLHLYVLSMGSSWTSLANRIEALCKNCAEILMKEEAINKDKRYNTGHKAVKVK